VGCTSRMLTQPLFLGSRSILARSFLQPFSSIPSNSEVEKANEGSEG